MRGEELLNGRSVAGSELTGQTQSRERNHARVSLEFFSKPRGGTLFLRLGSELQRIALAAGGFRPARRVGLGDVSGVDGDRAYATLMGRHHHPIGLILIHAEFCLEHGDDELARRVVVVEQNDFVQARPFRLQTNLGARLGSDVGHCSSTLRSSGAIFARSPSGVQFGASLHDGRDCHRNAALYSDRHRIARSRNRTGSRSPRCASSMIFFAIVSVAGSARSFRRNARNTSSYAVVSTLISSGPKT